MTAEDRADPRVRRRLLAEVSGSTVLGAPPGFLFGASYVSEFRSLGSDGGLALALGVPATALGGSVVGSLGGNLVGPLGGSEAHAATASAIGALLLAAAASCSWSVVGLLVGFGSGWLWNKSATVDFVHLCHERLGLAAPIDRLGRRAGNLIAPSFSSAYVGDLASGLRGRGTRSEAGWLACCSC